MVPTSDFSGLTSWAWALASAAAIVLNRECARLEVAGGSYRLVVAFDFRRQVAFVKFIGSHAEYDRIDALIVAQY